MVTKAAWRYQVRRVAGQSVGGGRLRKAFTNHRYLRGSYIATGGDGEKAHMIAEQKHPRRT